MSRLLFLFTLLMPLLHASAPDALKARYGSDLYSLAKEQVSGDQLADDFHYTIALEARQPLTDILLAEELPDGVAFVASVPPPLQIEGRILYWRIPVLNASSRHTVDMTVRLAGEGTYVTRTWAAPNPMAVLPLRAGVPRLEVTKTGPAFVEYGTDFTFDINISNTGNSTARNVRVIEIPPPTLSMGNFMPDQGDIPAGQTRQITLTARAQNKGSHTNLARAYHDGNPVPAEGSATVRVVESRISVELTGSARAYVFRPATWMAVVRNDGDCSINNVVLKLLLPPRVRVAEGDLEGQAVLSIGTLAPGQQRSVEVSATADKPLKADVRALASGVSVTGLECSAEARITTEWEAAPGILTSITDDVDPIRVGERASYRIEVVNQGAIRSVTVHPTLTLSEHLRPVSVSVEKEAASIRGQQVDFGEVTLAPGARRELKVVVSGEKSGAGKAILSLEAPFLAAPVIKEEATYVY